jgi:hypothetical protein
VPVIYRSLPVPTYIHTLTTLAVHAEKRASAGTYRAICTRPLEIRLRSVRTSVSWDRFSEPGLRCMVCSICSHLYPYSHLRIESYTHTKKKKKKECNLSRRLDESHRTLQPHPQPQPQPMPMPQPQASAPTLALTLNRDTKRTDAP